DTVVAPQTIGYDLAGEVLATAPQTVAKTARALHQSQQVEQESGDECVQFLARRLEVRRFRVDSEPVARCLLTLTKPRHCGPGTRVEIRRDSSECGCRIHHQLALRDKTALSPLRHQGEASQRV